MLGEYIGKIVGSLYSRSALQSLSDCKSLSNLAGATVKIYVDASLHPCKMEESVAEITLYVDNLAIPVWRLSHSESA